MIHEVKILVTCDGKHCRDKVEVTPDYTYSSYSGNSGSYDTDDSSIEEKLVADHGWVVGGGKQYCSDGCTPEDFVSDNNDEEDYDEDND